MPTYLYECDDCGIRFDAKKSIAERKTCNCPACEYGVGQQKITPVALDYLGMGTDPRGNPTAADKWAKMHEDKGSKKHLGIKDKYSSP